MTVGHTQQCADILVYDQDRKAQLFEAGKTPPDLRANKRREAFCRLIEYQQFADLVISARPIAMHLLLPAGKLVTHAAFAFRKPGNSA